MSTRQLFLSVRFAIAILSISVLLSRGGAQSIDDYAHRISDASLRDLGTSERPSSDCGDPLMNVPRSCNENLELFNTRSPQYTFHPTEPAGTVSAEALRHPLPENAFRSLKKAQDLIQAGDHVRALQQLRQTAKISSAAPYAYSLLGQEHLRLGQAEEAIPELQQAVRLLPSNVADRSNLGLALLMTGDTPGAERELEGALHLDPDNPRTQLVLGMALVGDSSHKQEGVEYLRAAERRLSTAHVVLAAFYARAGQMDAAEQEARAFLGPDRSSNPILVRNWIEFMARQAGTRAGFAFALLK